MINDNNSMDSVDEIALLKEGNRLADNYLSQEFFDDWSDENKEGMVRFLIETAICFTLRKKKAEESK